MKEDHKHSLENYFQIKFKIEIEFQINIKIILNSYHKLKLFKEIVFLKAIKK